jgi:hypothetical protein
MAFQQGLSGLNVSSKALDVISNNIANASTVGFKGGQAQFADVYAASLGVGGGSQVGIGASLPVVQQQFSQGNVSNSNNPLVSRSTVPASSVCKKMQRTRRLPTPVTVSSILTTKASSSMRRKTI